MKNRLQYFFTIVFALFICSNLLSAQNKKRGDPYADGENIYKHYSGTIGGRKAVLDLIWGYQGGSNFGGSYYYFTDSPGTYHFYITEPPTFDHNERMHANVVNDASPRDAGRRSLSDADITWDFQIIGRELNGIYRDKKIGIEQEIQLVETYGKPIAFDLVIGGDVGRITQNDGRTVNPEIFTLGIAPSAKTTNITEMDFLNKQLLKFVQTDQIQSEYIADFYRAYRVNFIRAAKIYFTQLFATGNAVNIDAPDYRSNIERRLFMLPVYNDTGFVVIRKDFTSGNKSEVTYLNLDVASRKQLQLKDILNVNTPWLSALIENAFLKQYDLSNGGSLNQWLTVEHLPVTENFRLAHQGIIFNYDKAVYLKDKNHLFWHPELSVYLTYNELRAMLTPEFAERLWP